MYMYTHAILPCVYKTHRLQLRLSDDDMAALDDQRGDLTRSEYLRRLIRSDAYEVEIVDTTTDHQNERSRPSRRVARDPARQPNHLVVVGPGDRHLHHFKKTGEPVRFHQGKPIYLYRCDCGTEKEE